MTKFIRYRTTSGVSYGTLEGDTVHEIQGGLFDAHTPTGATHKLSDVKLLYPCEAGKILAVGLNYKSHLGSRPQPAHPGDVLQAGLRPAESGRPDRDSARRHRRPLRGRDGGRRRQAPAQRLASTKRAAAVFGVTAGNDVSDRSWQHGEKKDLQWWRAKGSDTFAPLGPAILCGADYGKLLLQTRINGETVQKQYTSDLIFDVPAVLSWISGWVTLLPGDLVYTGTPGNTRKMSPGDVSRSRTGRTSVSSPTR